MTAAPADPITAVLDAMIAELQRRFGWDAPKRALTEIKPLEFPLDEKAERIEGIRAPGLYPVFFGARPTAQVGAVEAMWGFYAISTRATIPARTGGDSSEMGSYAIAARAARVLDEFDTGVPGASPLKLEGIENLSDIALARRHMSVVAVTVTGVVAIGLGDAADDLADFLHFHADFDLRPFDDPPAALPVDNPDAALDVALPGASE